MNAYFSGQFLTTFREVEARFRYYDFPGVTIDRYTLIKSKKVRGS